MQKPPKSDTDLGLPSSGLVDDDLARRSWKGPVAIAAAAMAVSALLFVALKQLATPDRVPERKAVVVETFAVDDPREAGYVAPQLIGELKPDWPEGIGGSPYKGKVTVGLVVSPAGDVAEVTIVRSLQETIDGVARRTARKMKFRPATRDGAPSEARILIEIPFEPF